MCYPSVMYTSQRSLWNPLIYSSTPPIFLDFFDHTWCNKWWFCHRYFPLLFHRKNTLTVWLPSLQTKQRNQCKVHPSYIFTVQFRTSSRLLYPTLFIYTSTSPILFIVNEDYTLTSFSSWYFSVTTTPTVTTSTVTTTTVKNTRELGVSHDESKFSKSRGDS